MKYISTRGAIKLRHRPRPSLRELQKIRGYMFLSVFPSWTKIRRPCRHELQEVAFLVLSKFLTDYTEEELRYSSTTPMIPSSRRKKWCR